MKTGKPGVSLGCRGDRATGALQFGEVRVTMTIDALLKALDGMETVEKNGDYEEKSVNKIFYDNDRRKACVKLAFRLRFIYSSYKIACQEQAGNPPVF